MNKIRMNDPLDDLLKRSRRVLQGQLDPTESSQEVPRPGFVERVLAARSAAPSGSSEWFAGLTRAARWGVAASACVVLSLWSLPAPVTAKANTIEAAASAWDAVGPRGKTITWGGL